MTDDLTLLPLTSEEQTLLCHQEAIIERGLETFIEVGNALTVIRDRRLYRDQFPTFADYCRHRWGMVRRQADRLIAASSVIETLRPFGPLLPANEAQARPLTNLTPDQQVEVWQHILTETGGQHITAAQVQRAALVLTNKVHYVVSGHPSPEWYTPTSVIEAAREVMGGIDLDPASSETAQAIVKAATYYTKEQNGLTLPWHGRVWLNPPYHAEVVGPFATRLAQEYEAGTIVAGILLVNNATDTVWFQDLMTKYPVCFSKGRFAFWNPTATNPQARRGSAVFYLGKETDRFRRVFGRFGTIMRSW